MNIIVGGKEAYHHGFTIAKGPTDMNSTENLMTANAVRQYVEDNVQDFYNPFINSTYTIDGSKIYKNYKNLFVIDGPRIIMKDPKEEFNLKIRFPYMYNDEGYITITNNTLKEKGFHVLVDSENKSTPGSMIVEEYDGENAFMFCFPENQVRDAVADDGNIYIWGTGSIGDENFDNDELLTINGPGAILNKETLTYSPGKKLYTENALRQCLQSFLLNISVDGKYQITKFISQLVPAKYLAEYVEDKISSLDSRLKALEGKT